MPDESSVVGAAGFPPVEASVESIYAHFWQRKRLGESPDPTEYLARYPQQSAELQRQFEIYRLVEDAFDGDSLWSTLAADDDRAGEEAPPRQRIGEYEVVRLLGEGSFGQVYEAIHPALGRRVALKILKAGRAIDRQALTRFEVEAKAMASLDCPGVVPIYGVGRWQGTPFFAMRLIEGLDLNACIRFISDGASEEPALIAPPAFLVELRDLRKHDEREYCRRMADLVARVADALNQAHLAGIVHRDVTPRNIVLDDQGAPWITDFGLAQMGEMSLTLTGDIVGTARYMSPEQATASRFVDQRTDIFSLGATLYELLTLQPAFPGDTPTVVVQQIIDCRPARLRQVFPAAPKPLEAILDRAIAERPNERFASAAEMAEELRRFVNGRPSATRPLGAATRKWRRWRRHPKTLAGIAIATFSVLIIVLVTAQWYLIQLTNANRRLADEIERAETTALVADAGDVAEALDRGDARAARKILRRSLETPTISQLERGPEWRLLEMMSAEVRPRCEWLAHVGGANEVVELLDRSGFVSVGNDGFMRLWRFDSTRPTKSFRVEPEERNQLDRALHALAVAPDGDRAATGNQEVALWDLRSGRRGHALITCPSTVESLQFAPDGASLAIACRYHWLRALDLEGKVLGEVDVSGRQEALYFLSQGRRLLADTPGAAENHGLGLWNWPALNHGQSIPFSGDPRYDKIRTFAVSADEQWIAVVSAVSGIVEVRNLVTQQSIAAMPQRGESATCLAFSPDRTLLVAGQGNGLVRVWRVMGSQQDETWKLEESRGFVAHNGPVKSTKFAVDGSLLTTGDDGFVRQWDLLSHGPAELTPQAGVGKCWMSPNGRQILLANSEFVQQVAIENGSMSHEMPLNLPLREVEAAAYDADGSHVALGDRYGRVSVIATEGSSIWSRLHIYANTPIRSLAYSKDNSLIAAGAVHGWTSLWSAADGTLLFRHRWESAEDCLAVAFVRNGSLLACSVGNKGIQFLDVVSGKPHSSIPTPSTVETLLEVGSRYLVAGQRDGQVAVYDLNSMQQVAVFAAHKAAAAGLASLEDKVVLSSSHDGTVQMIDVKTWRPLGLLYRDVLAAAHGGVQENRRPVGRVMASADGSVVAASLIGPYPFGKIVLWDLSAKKR
jgi:hypothetical protein